MPLLYHPHWDEARARLTRWWNGEDIGRPAMNVWVQRDTPHEDIPALPEPPGWVTGYSTRSHAYRVNCALRATLGYDHYGESCPAVASGDLAPNCLALYLGCKGVEMPGTVWCEPTMERPEDARFDLDPANVYWRFSLGVYREVKQKADGKFFQQFPDLIEGLDTLAAMRGSEPLLCDLIERPAWVHACLRQITDRYFHCYDVFYDLIRDEVGGSFFWAWAPGRMSKFQCDFSAMISPEMFGEFMVPVLREMTERVSYCMYHWDGPGALPHHDHLLSLPDLDMLQWTPGAGNEPTWHRRWWPIYHKTLEAGKKLIIGAENREQLLALKKAFGPRIRNMMISIRAKDAAEADEILKMMEG
jgi:hypothetical protein